MSFEDRLREGFHRAAAAMPDVPVQWESTVTKARRARRRRAALVTVAALAVSGGVAWAALSLEGRGASTGGTISPAGSDASSDPHDQRPAHDAELARAVRSRTLDWIKAVSLGDTGMAWSWMAPASREHFGDISRFEDSLPALQEGWGAWHDGASGQVNTDTRVMVSGGLETAGVVTVYGRVTKEGVTSFDVDAMPFRSIDGAVFVDPFSSKVEIAPIEPASEEEYGAGDLPDVFEAEVPSDVSQVNLYVDGESSSGRDATLTQMPDSGDGQPPKSIASSPAPAELQPGPHALTIALIDASGGIAVRTVTFTVFD